jgi:hypothetical protein
MRAGFKVETRHCDFWDKVLVVTNYDYINLIVNFPMISYPKKNRMLGDVGMWRVKQLKN